MKRVEFPQGGFISIEVLQPKKLAPWSLHQFCGFRDVPCWFGSVVFYNTVRIRRSGTLVAQFDTLSKRGRIYKPDLLTELYLLG